MGIFDNAQTVMINNKEVQSIKLASNNAVLYEKTIVDNYLLTLTSDKDILSYYDNESAILTATLTNNDVPVENELVIFDMDNSESRNITSNTSSPYTVSSDCYKITLNIPSGQRSGRITIYGNPSSQYALQINYNNGSWYLYHPPSSTTIQLSSNIIYVNGDTLYYVNNTGTLSSFDLTNYDATKLYLTSVSGTVITTNLFAKATDSNGQANVSYDSKGTGDINIKVTCMNLQEIYVIEDCSKYITTESTGGDKIITKDTYYENMIIECDFKSNKNSSLLSCFILINGTRTSLSGIAEDYFARITCNSSKSTIYASNHGNESGITVPYVSNQWYHFKFIKTGSSHLKVYVDDTVMLDADVTSKSYDTMALAQVYYNYGSADMHIKNLKIKKFTPVTVV